MPVEINLSEKIILCFKVLDMLNDWHADFDSSSPEHKIFEAEVQYYLSVIRNEVSDLTYK